MRKEASLRKVRQIVSSLSLSMEDTMARVNVGNNCFLRQIENVLALWGNVWLLLQLNPQFCAGQLLVCFAVYFRHILFFITFPPLLH